MPFLSVYIGWFFDTLAYHIASLQRHSVHLNLVLFALNKEGCIVVENEL